MWTNKTNIKTDSSWIPSTIDMQKWNINASANDNLEPL
jgi:hypothetical protein